MKLSARTLLAALAIAAAAFLLYDSTLLPGQDLGDTASFQATVGEPYLSVRQAYPLYYATGNLFFAAVPGNAARAINLASAVFGALACGLLALVVAALTRRTLAGVVAGLLFATSYTFWSQAIIAEVYALHACLMGLCFLALVLWARRPTLSRLALFFGLYALGFGNHLSMILLLPGFALFLLLVAPDGPKSMVRARVALIAAGLAALGACQYLWNLLSLLERPDRDPSLIDLLQTFWFDVTKADWRATMVAGVPEGAWRDRLAMYWFDLHQQFGWPGVLLAVAGIVWVFWPGRLFLGQTPESTLDSGRRTADPGLVHASAAPRRPVVGLAFLVLFLVNWGFAFTYNVGDTHVFYIPSHFMVALFAGLGAGGVLSLVGGSSKEGGGGSVGGARRNAVAVVAGLALLSYPAWRAYDTYPALDRSRDWQVKQFFDRLTAGLDRRQAVLAADLNWQLHNGLDYYAKYNRADLGVGDTMEMLPYFPFVVESNREIGRGVAVTDGAAPMIRTAYGDLFDIQPDERVNFSPFSARIARFPTGSPYVLTLLEPYPDNPVDEADLAEAVARLTGGHLKRPQARYNVIAGRVGEKPAFVRSDSRPFRVSVRAGNVEADVRIECWLPADTIRRMGFGRVIVAHQPALTLDRGASFVGFDANGRVAGVEYGWAILAPQRRWIIAAAPGRGQQATPPAAE